LQKYKDQPVVGLDVKFGFSYRGTSVEGAENMALRKIFGSKRDEVAGDWR
jgi:hypothetical protein